MKVRGCRKPGSAIDSEHLTCGACPSRLSSQCSAQDVSIDDRDVIVENEPYKTLQRVPVRFASQNQGERIRYVFAGERAFAS